MQRIRRLFPRVTDRAILDLIDIVIIAVCAFWLVIACVSLAAPSRADAATDNAGRDWFGTVALSAAPAADQFVGIQFAQVRRGLPGVWLDARAGDGRRSAFGGIVVRLADWCALRAGAGLDAPGDDLTVEVAGGATFAWRRLSAHAGIDSGTGALSCGAGVTFWR